MDDDDAHNESVGFNTVLTRIPRKYGGVVEWASITRVLVAIVY